MQPILSFATEQSLALSKFTDILSCVLFYLLRVILVYIIVFLCSYGIQLSQCLICIKMFPKPKIYLHFRNTFADPTQEMIPYRSHFRSYRKITAVKYSWCIPTSCKPYPGVFQLSRQPSYYSLHVKLRPLNAH